MSKEEKSKKIEEDSDLTTNLLRQMGLAEEEIKSAMELADRIEKKVEIQKEIAAISAPATVAAPVIVAAPKQGPKPKPSKNDQVSKQDLLNIIEQQNAKLNHFQNVVAVQLVLLIKKYKDKLISLENNLQEKNAQITSLERALQEKKTETEKLSKRLEFLLK